MRPGVRQDTVKAWQFQNLLLELYEYAPGRPRGVTRHTHEEYQLGLCLDFSGEYRYRGSKHPAPVGSLSILHPGEPHSTLEHDFHEVPTTFRMLFIPPEVIQTAATLLTSRTASLPFFPDPVLFDKNLTCLFLGLHKTLEIGASLLEKEGRLLRALTELIMRHAADRPQPSPVGRERVCVQRARAYLHDNYAKDISLAQLARVANLSPNYFNTVFRAEVGLPPHIYQTQVRVACAKKLLAVGRPITEVALDTGFFDQSHFNRHFRRLVGVTPANYQQDRKNVQDSYGH